MGIYPQSVTPQERSGGRQASMILCAEMNNGTPLLGRKISQEIGQKSNSKSENSFCKFADGSYLSASGFNRAMVYNAKKKGIYPKNKTILHKLKDSQVKIKASKNK